MKILAIDSCAGTSSVAVLEDEALLALYTVNSGNTHSETLLPMIRDTLSTLGISNDDIDAYAVSYGPGSFTGVRIGVSTVKGLALGRNKPCVEVSTIEALATNLDGFDGVICPVMNARRGQVYTGIFKNGERLMEDNCMMLTDLIPILEGYGEKIYFVGDGYDLAAKAGVKSAMVTPEPLRHANGYSVGRVAYEKIKKGETVTDSELSVNYLRKPQAEREREERLAKEKNI